MRMISFKQLAVSVWKVLPSVFCLFSHRSLCCCYLSVVLAITSMGVQYTAMQIQTWRKWTTIWKEKLYVYQQTTCCVTYIWSITMALLISHYIHPVSVFLCLKESLCGQRGLLPNTDVQTFQVSLTNRLRSQYDRIREPLSRVCAFSCNVYNSLINT